MVSSLHPVLHLRGPILVSLHPAEARRLKLTSSSRQDALRVFKVGRPDSWSEQCLRSGCATVSRGARWMRRRCVVGAQSAGS